MRPPFRMRSYLVQANLSITDCHLDNGPQLPYLTLPQEVAKLVDGHSSGGKPAALYHGGADMESSSICLKETEEGKLAFNLN